MRLIRAVEFGSVHLVEVLLQELECLLAVADLVLEIGIHLGVGLAVALFRLEHRIPAEGVRSSRLDDLAQRFS